MKPQHYIEPQVTVWDELWPAVDLFTRYSNQWRAGPGGAFALDYGVIQHDLARRNLTDADYDEIMAAISIIEREALGQLTES